MSLKQTKKLNRQIIEKIRTERQRERERERERERGKE